MKIDHPEHLVTGLIIRNQLGERFEVVEVLPEKREVMIRDADAPKGARLKWWGMNYIREHFEEEGL